MEKALKKPFVIHRSNVFWILTVHVLALAAIPFFTWSLFWVAMVGVFIVAPLGINMGYHRLLTHQAFRSPNWLTYTLVTIGAALGGGAPIYWAAAHRAHHHFSDQEGDPHNSRRGFWYSHVLHLFNFTSEESTGSEVKKYASDLTKDTYLVWLNKNWLWFAVATIPLAYALGGVGLVLCGVFFRLALMWNIMWFVNSASHKWGYQTYKTNDETRNCWWVGLLAAGEGWHNNHHAFPRCAAHGRKWWEMDTTYMMIRGLEKMGIISHVKHAVEPKMEFDPYPMPLTQPPHLPTVTQPQSEYLAESPLE